MAKKPDLEREILFGVNPEQIMVACDATPPKGYEFYSDGRALVSVNELVKIFGNAKNPGDSIGTSRIGKEASTLFTSVSSNPSRTHSSFENFFINSYGTTCVEYGDLMTLVGVTSLTGERVGVAGVLSASTINQFAGMFMANLVIFDNDNVRTVVDAAIDSIGISVLAMAYYNYLLADETTDEDGYRRHVRAARKILADSIVGPDTVYSGRDEETKRLFGDIAFRKMLEKLKELGYGDDPGMEIIEARRAKSCMVALQATDDDFFLGVATGMGGDITNAYLKAIVDSRVPRAV